MKAIIFTLFFAFACANIFAANAITKEDLKTKYAKEAYSLKKDLTEKQQNSLQQAKSKYFKEIIAEVNLAINKSLEISEQTYKKYKDNPNMTKEYIASLKQNVEALRVLQQSDAAVFIADYANKKFDITKIKNLRALCFFTNNITLDFEYFDKKVRIIYLEEGQENNKSRYIDIVSA